MFELGEDLLDRVEVGAVWRQEQQARAGASDRLADGGPLVAAQIIHDDDVARFECRDQELLDVIGEALAVDRLVEHAWCVDPVAAKRCEEGHRAPVAIGHLGMKSPPLGCPATQRGHVRLGPGLIDEDQALRIKPGLIFFPLFAPPCDLWAKLFGGQYAFF